MSVVRSEKVELEGERIIWDGEVAAVKIKRKVFDDVARGEKGKVWITMDLLIGRQWMARRSVCRHELS
jgi:hypothetical protein